MKASFAIAEQIQIIEREVNLQGLIKNLTEGRFSTSCWPEIHESR